jgi:drug/metabolite transporter (DMT)-like permease
MPLSAAFLYAVAAICIKMALGHGVNMWKITFLSNLVMGGVFLPLALTGHANWVPSALPLAGVAGLLFFAGQVATFRSLQSGDVSIATPALASKVVFVALLGLLVPETRSGPWLWLAVGLTMAGVILLQSGARHPASHPLATLLWAILAALSFAAADILVQIGAPRAGVTLFLPVMFLTVALVSFPLLWPRVRKDRHIPTRPGAGWWTACGVIVLGLQAMIMGTSIGLFGDAAGANILYGSRGLWSLLLLALIARHMGLTDSVSHGGTFALRLIGGLLILSAVILILR